MGRCFVFCLVSLFLHFSIVSGQSKDEFREDSLTILFAGDVMGHMPQVHAAFDSNTRTYNFTPCFQFVKPILDSVDIAIANLETTLAGSPYTGYPLFSSPDALARDLVAAGFDILATANNHCYDKGKYGMERTIKVLDSLKVPHMGTYIDERMRDTLYPLIILKHGLKIALFNYTYGTNGIPVDSPNVVNVINRRQILRDIQRADSMHVDVKIVFLHWGREYEPKPSDEQKSLARFLVQSGMDIVVGSHPHVVQTYEEIMDTVRKKNVPIFYSLGNFISNQRDPNRDGGAMAFFTIKWRVSPDSVRAFSVHTQYCPYWVYKGVLDGKYQYYVLPLPDSFSLPVPSEAQTRMKEYFEHIVSQLHNLPMKVVKLPQR